MISLNGGSSNLRKFIFNYTWNSGYDVPVTITHNLNTTKIVNVTAYITDTMDGTLRVVHDYVHFGWPWWVDRGFIYKITSPNEFTCRFFNCLDDATHQVEIHITGTD